MQRAFAGALCDAAANGDVSGDCGAELLGDNAQLPPKEWESTKRQRDKRQVDHDKFNAQIEQQDPTGSTDAGDVPDLLVERPTRVGASAHADLNRGEARELFTATFDPLLDVLDADPLRDQGEIVAFKDANTAIVDAGPGESPKLVDSTIPLRIREGGKSRAIDLSLSETSDGFEPERTLVDLTLPTTVDEPVVLEKSGLRIRYLPSHSDAAKSTADPVRDAGLLYPNSDTDTDVFIAQQSTGVEFFAQLRSAESPEGLRWRLGLPDGAKLRESRILPGIVEVVGNGERYAEIRPPTALDARGEPVEVTMTVEGTELVLSVPHRGSQAAYPILVDPTVQDTYDWPNYDNFVGWELYQNDSDYTIFRVHRGQCCGVPVGLTPWAYQNRNYAAWSRASGIYRVPHFGNTSAYIAAVNVSNLQNHRGNDPWTRPYMRFGLQSYADGWHWSHLRDISFNYSAANWYIGAPDQTSTIYEFSLVNPSSGGVTLPNDWLKRHWASIGSATIYLDDHETPTVDFTGVRERGWVGDGASLDVGLNTSDQGLGVEEILIGAGWDENGDIVYGDNPEDGCTGTVRSPCSQQWLYETTIDTAGMRDGLQVVEGIAWDPVGKDSGLIADYFGVDRTAPTLTELSGNLVEGAGDALHVIAVDGDPGGRDPQDADGSDLAGAESGVKSIELLIDGQRVAPAHFVEQQCEGDGVAEGEPGDSSFDPSDEIPWGSCTLEADFVVPEEYVGVPDVLIELVILDQAGNETRTVAGDSTEPSVEISGSLTDAEGELSEQLYTLDVAVEDPSGPAGSPVSGLSEITIYVDTEVAHEELIDCDPTCPTSSSVAYEYDRDAWAAGGHVVQVLANDQVENIGTASLNVGFPDPAAPPEPAACPTPDAAPAASDPVSEADALTTFEAGLPEAVEPSVPTVDTDLEVVLAEAFVDDPDVDPTAEATLDPSTVDANPDRDIVGTQANGEISDDPADGVSVGDLCLRPDAAALGSEGVAVAEDDAILFPNSHDGTDTLVRPTATGATIVEQVREPGAPETFSWELGLAENEDLVELDSGAVAITVPPNPVDLVTGAFEDPLDEDDLLGNGEVIDPDLVRPAGAESPEALNEAELQLADGNYQRDAAQEELDDEFGPSAPKVVGVVAPPIATDSAGAQLPTILQATADKLILVMDRSGPGLSYPVYARSSLGRYVPPGQEGAGPQIYGCLAIAERPFRFTETIRKTGRKKKRIHYGGEGRCNWDFNWVDVSLRHKSAVGFVPTWPRVDGTGHKAWDGPANNINGRVGIKNHIHCRRSHGVEKNYRTQVYTGVKGAFDVTAKDKDHSNENKLYCSNE